jgi:hypothetical protein
MVIDAPLSPPLLPSFCLCWNRSAHLRPSQLCSNARARDRDAELGHAHFEQLAAHAVEQRLWLTSEFEKVKTTGAVQV